MTELSIGIAFRSCLSVLNFLVRFPNNYTIDTDSDKGKGNAEKSMGFTVKIKRDFTPNI
jgi:hypothetical protein